MNERQGSSEQRRFEQGMDILARLENEIWFEEKPVVNEQQGTSDNSLPASRPVFRRPSLRAILADLEPLSAPTILIGACEDGLPVLVDLSKPQGHSLLILGGPHSGKSALLQSILVSACLINPPRKMRFSCIGPALAEFDPVLSEPHCYRFSDPTEEMAVKIVHELAALAEERALGKHPGPVVILAIDDLQGVLDILEEEDTQRLLWLIEHGPAFQVWTVATLDASRNGATGLMDRFRTWLVGEIALDQQEFLPNHLRQAHPELLAPGVQFCAYFEEDWIRFWVPRLDTGHEDR